MGKLIAGPVLKNNISEVAGGEGEFLLVGRQTPTTRFVVEARAEMA